MSDPAEVPTASPLLETVGLACERDWRMLFERLDLRLAAGEMLQVVGPNGSGKTSLLRLLYGLMQQNAGEVRLIVQTISDKQHDCARRLLWLVQDTGSTGLISVDETRT
ncbi:ATP-binding cassette domain-containing protein [Pseudomonas aeruginosa]|nr:ATP-binding cassette domain-containing protein [Pseudomonas aeruginosa]